MMSQEKKPTDKHDGNVSGFSLWGLGNSLVESVTQNATTFVSTIVETDWNKELTTIQHDLQEDTKTVERHLGISAPAATTSTAQGTQQDVGTSSSVHQDGGFSLAALGRSLMTGTAEIFQQVKDDVGSEVQSMQSDLSKRTTRTRPASLGAGKAKFSRLDMQISSMQRDSGTFCDDPNDAAAFEQFCADWKAEERQSEIDGLLSSNVFMCELHTRLVPSVVEDQVFWQRYFFRLQEVVKHHEQRQKRLQRATERAAGSGSDTIEGGDSLAAALAGTESSAVSTHTASKSVAADQREQEASKQEDGNGTWGFTDGELGDDAGKEEEEEEDWFGAPEQPPVAPLPGLQSPAAADAAPPVQAPADDTPGACEAAIEGEGHGRSAADAAACLIIPATTETPVTAEAVHTQDVGQLESEGSGTQDVATASSAGAGGAHVEHPAAPDTTVGIPVAKLKAVGDALEEAEECDPVAAVPSTEKVADGTGEAVVGGVDDEGVSRRDSNTGSGEESQSAGNTVSDWSLVSEPAVGALGSTPRQEAQGVATEGIQEGNEDDKDGGHCVEALGVAAAGKKGDDRDDDDDAFSSLGVSSDGEATGAPAALPDEDGEVDENWGDWD